MQTMLEYYRMVRRNVLEGRERLAAIRNALEEERIRLKLERKRARRERLAAESAERFFAPPGTLFFDRKGRGIPR